VEKGHAHANAIKQWVAAVDNTYKHFSSRMDKYRYINGINQKFKKLKCNFDFIFLGLNWKRV